MGQQLGLAASLACGCGRRGTTGLLSSWDVASSAGSTKPSRERAPAERRRRSATPGGAVPFAG